MRTDNTTNQRSNRNKIVLISSLFTSIYFAVLIGSYYFKFDNQVLNFVRELFTIPAVILLLVLSVISGMALVKENKKFNSLPFYSCLILLLTIVLLIVSS
jgi:cytochrome bd-type quinol oxidase subunit 2